MPTDIEIARAAKLEPILKIAEKIGIPADAIEPYGTKIAKVDLDFLAQAQERAKSKPKSKLILVTAINPTAAGEGKTTTSVGLADALRVIGKKSVVACASPARPLLRHEGRRRRRRLCAGRADGGRSTCISPAISTPSPPRIICSRR